MGNGLKAVLFDFNGVIINDEAIHHRLIDQLLIDENMRPKPQEYRSVCLGRSDRACVEELFSRRGRVLAAADLDALLERKSQRYCAQLDTMETLPIYPGVADLAYKLRVAKVPMAVVSDALRGEIEQVLERADLAKYFSVIVGSEDTTTSKPDPTGHLKAIDALQQQHPEVERGSAIAIEDTFAGIEAAKAAGLSVVGVANTYPYHMIQRQANWAVDYLNELELDRVERVMATDSDRVSAAVDGA
ncbi:MAG: HAD family phosphatase [Elainellaceae cyanobacterium]